MELIKEAITVGEVLYAGCLEIPADGDLIVPDIKPDILKVVGVDATACLSKKEITDGRLTLGGKVNISVLYIPDKADCGIQSIHTAFDFSEKLERTEIDDTCHGIVSADIVKVDFHVINSRKLSIRAVVGADCEILSAREFEYASDAEDAEIQLGGMSVNSLCSMHEEEFMIREAVEIPNGKASVKEILKLDYKICDKELKLLTEKIIVKGTLCICLLYLDTSDNLEYTDAEIPFTEVFDFPDVDEDMKCSVNYRICDCFYELSEDSDGDRRIINLELMTAVEMKAEKTHNINMIKDCYFPGLNTKFLYEDVRLTTSICTPSCQNAIRDVVVVDKSLPQIASVYNVITRAFITKSSVEEHKLLVEGKIHAYVLYISDNETMPVYSVTKEIPFSYMLESPNAMPGMDCDVTAEVGHTSYHVNVANEVEIRCILCIEGNIYSTEKVSVISDVQSSDISPENRKGIVIYFVQPGDTLWKIAKSYSVSVDKIADFNNLENKDKLSVGQRLIIPTTK